MSARYAVYRLHARCGALLYIGQGFEPHRRLTEHRARKSWGAEIDHMTVEWFTNRPDAMIHERGLTLALSPKYPTVVTGEAAHTRARAQVVGDLRRGPKYHNEPCPDDPKSVAAQMLSDAGYFDDSVSVPRERPMSQADRDAELAVRGRLIAQAISHEWAAVRAARLAS